MPIFSAHWYRVRNLKPRLRANVRIRRHVYRGEIWFVVHDEMTGRIYRFDTSASRVIGLMNGDRSVDDIWHAVVVHAGDQAPTQDDTISLLSRMSRSDLLMTDTLPDVGEMDRRSDQERKKKIWQRVKTPLSIKVPIFDPDRFLTKTTPHVDFIFSKSTAVIWLLSMLIAIAHIAVALQDSVPEWTDQLFTIQNGLMMLAVYPFVKALHELGHAYAAKTWGADVHEFGVMLLLFFPVPYVDATSTNAWPEKWRRALVAAMGIMVEVTLAVVAAVIWLNVEAGFVADAAFAVFMTAGISTVVVNGNPLLRFDGYYVLADVSESPNLGPRANTDLGYLFKKFVLGLRTVKGSARTIAEGIFFVVYAVAAFLYRMFIGITIIFFIANHYFFVGVLMAIVYGFQILIMPVLNGLGYLMSSKELGGIRLRAVFRCIALCAVIGLGLAVVPVPHRGVLQGVVWMPEQARIVAGGSGLVEDVPVTDGVHLAQGDVVAVSSSDALSARIAGLKARVDELEARAGLALTDSPSQAYQVNQHLTHARRMLSVAQAQAAALIVRAPRAGRFVAVADGAVKGKYLRRGDVIGFVIDGDAPVILRLAVSEFDADLVRASQGKADVRFSDDLGTVYPAQVMRELPLAGNTLPSKAISTQGGGPFQLNPDPKNPLRTVGRIVTFELVVPQGPVLSRVGTRAFVRVNYGARPLLWQLYRPARQLILRHLWM